MKCIIIFINIKVIIKMRYGQIFLLCGSKKLHNKEQEPKQ